MLHTKFRGNQPRGSGEEDILWFLPYMGIVAILAMRPGPFEQIFNIPLPGNLREIGPAVSDQQIFVKMDDADKMMPTIDNGSLSIL